MSIKKRHLSLSRCGDDTEGWGELIWLMAPLANLACDSFCLVTQGNKLSHIAHCITQLQISKETGGWADTSAD